MLLLLLLKGPPAVAIVLLPLLLPLPVRIAPPIPSVC
jgi:hypothetical protein